MKEMVEREWIGRKEESSKMIGSMLKRREIETIDYFCHFHFYSLRKKSDTCDIYMKGGPLKIDNQ